MQQSSDATAALSDLVGREIVLDTAGPITYLGTLQSITPEGYWLSDADIRDRTEGHMSKEVYVREARLNGIQPNRKSIFVFAGVVISCSTLSDVIVD